MGESVNFDRGQNNHWCFAYSKVYNFSKLTSWQKMECQVVLMPNNDQCRRQLLCCGSTRGCSKIVDSSNQVHCFWNCLKITKKHFPNTSEFWTIRVRNDFRKIEKNLHLMWRLRDFQSFIAFCHFLLKCARQIFRSTCLKLTIRTIFTISDLKSGSMANIIFTS